MRIKYLYLGAAVGAALAIPAAVTAATPQQLFTGGLESTKDSSVQAQDGCQTGLPREGVRRPRFRGHLRR